MCKVTKLIGISYVLGRKKWKYNDFRYPDNSLYSIFNIF